MMHGLIRFTSLKESEYLRARRMYYIWHRYLGCVVLHEGRKYMVYRVEFDYVSVTTVFLTVMKEIT